MPSLPTALNVELLTKTTYKLLRPFEVVALLLQATNLFASAVNDRHDAWALRVLIVLGFVHLAFAALVIKYPGPLTRGWEWTAAWIAFIFVVQILLARLSAPGDFAVYGTGIPIGVYSQIPLAMFAFYPWTGFREPAKRRTIEAGLILAVVVHPIVIVGLMTRWHFTAGHVRSFAVYAVWAVVWFSVGKGISWLFRIAVQGETEALTASYDATVGDLHTYVDNAVLAIESGDDPHEVAVRLRVHIAERRKELTKVEDHVAAVSIFENAIRAYAGRLELRSTPEVGTFTIPREHAILVDHGLSDLLKNVVVHGEGVAELDLVVRDGVMILDVRDFGPGLARDQFDEPDTSLQRLRRRLHRHGGDLQLRHPGGSGAAVRLSLPVRPRR